MSNSNPSRVVTPNDFSSIPDVISYFLGVTAVLCISAKYATKLSMTRIFTMDDIFILISLLFFIGMIISVSVQTANGLGKREASQSYVQLLRFQKSSYAGDLLFILSLFFSKTSVLFLLRALGRAGKDRRMVYITGGVIALWALSGLLVAAFQCPLPHAWEGLDSKCVNLFSFWAYFDIMNIISELLLIVVPYILMSRVQIPHKKKIIAMIVFALRIFVVGAIIPELYFRHRAWKATDTTFARWPVVVCTLFVQCLSIIFSCVPYLRPFFSALEGGMESAMTRIDDTKRRSDPTSGIRKQKNGDWSACKPGNFVGSNKSTKMKNSSSRGWLKIGTETGISAGGKSGPDDDISSTSNIIRTTTFFTVHSEEAGENREE